MELTGENIKGKDESTILNSKQLLVQCCNSVNKIQIELTRERGLKKQYEDSLNSWKKELARETRLREQAEREVSRLIKELKISRELYQLKNIDAEKWKAENEILKNENEILYKKIEDDRISTKVRIAEILRKLGDTQPDLPPCSPIKIEIDQELKIIELKEENKQFRKTIEGLQETVKEQQQKICKFEIREKDENELTEKWKTLKEKDARIKELESEISSMTEMNFKLQMENKDLLMQVGDFIQDSNETLVNLQQERENCLKQQRDSTEELRKLKDQIKDILEENYLLKNNNKLLNDKIETLENFKRKEEFLKQHVSTLKQVQYKRWEFDDIIQKRRIKNATTIPLSSTQNKTTSPKSSSIPKTARPQYKTKYSYYK